jgi:hypothetical protein
MRDGWQDEQNEGSDFGMRIASLVFERNATLDIALRLS